MKTESINQKQLQQLPVLCPVFNIRAASRLITQQFDDILKPSGLQITQFSVLVGVGLEGNPTINQLAKTLVMDRTTLTRGLKPLESMGLLKIKKGEDKRTSTVELTSKGVVAINKTTPFWKKARDSAAEKFGEKFLKALNKELTSFRETN